MRKTCDTSPRVIFTNGFYISARPSNNLAFYRDLTLESRAANSEPIYLDVALFYTVCCFALLSFTFIRDCSFAHITSVLFTLTLNNRRSTWHKYFNLIIILRSHVTFCKILFFVD